MGARSASMRESTIEAVSIPLANPEKVTVPVLLVEDIVDMMFEPLLRSLFFQQDE
jgi:hypothetical protein